MDNKRRKIVIASPRDPCGATWLINCFLELGILTYRTDDSRNMWQQEGSRFFLKSHEDILKKWLPSLSAHASFSFSPDIEVEWVHEWPTERFRDNQIILFLRDPRDAIYSRYKREAPKNMGYREYVEFLDPHTLLDKAETNAIFTSVWLQHPNCREFNFEDYKVDAESTLRRVLEYIGKTASDQDIAIALSASTAKKAAEAEECWNNAMQRHAHNANREICQVVNQGGVIGRWQELQGSDRAVAVRIDELRCMIVKPSDKGGQGFLTSYLSYLQKHSSFKKLPYSAVSKNTDPQEADILEKRALLFAHQLTYQKAVSSGLHQYEIKVLLNNLADLAYSRDSMALRNIKKQYKAIAPVSHLYLGIYRRTGSLRALLRCNPLYIVKLVVRKYVFGIVQRIGATS